LYIDKGVILFADISQKKSVERFRISGTKKGYSFRSLSFLSQKCSQLKVAREITKRMDFASNKIECVAESSYSSIQNVAEISGSNNQGSELDLVCVFWGILP